MFELILLIFICFYFIQTFVFAAGASKKFPKLSDDELPSATVIVAARNEEENILDCLRSLNSLEYPAGKLQIIIIDDNSTDSTAELITEFTADKNRFLFLKTKLQLGELKGKSNAIANAIESATGEIILTTDADCIVSPLWAKTIASYYQKDVALVCGYTTKFDDTPFNGMQAVDFIYLLEVAAGTINIGQPLSCIGNNMSYRKSVYDQVGGYKALPFSVTEDSLLLLAIKKLGKYKLIYPLDKEALVTSKPCPDFKTLFHQKKRWGVGGLDNTPFGFTVMATAFITHLMVLLSPFFMSLNIIYMIIFKILTDYFFLLPVFNRLELKLSLKNFMAFEIYYFSYVIILPIALLFGKKVEWKGRTFN